VEFEPAHAAGWSLQSRRSISTLRTHRVRLDERPLDRVEEEIHLSALGRRHRADTTGLVLGPFQSPPRVAGWLRGVRCARPIFNRSMTEHLREGKRIAEKRAPQSVPRRQPELEDRCRAGAGRAPLDRENGGRPGPSRDRNPRGRGEFPIPRLTHHLDQRARPVRRCRPPTGLSCRVYRAQRGISGAPSVEVHSLDTRGTLWECDDGCQRGDTAVMARRHPFNALTKGCDHARCF
jgi:hypothetical protein